MGKSLTSTDKSIMSYSKPVTSRNKNTETCHCHAKIKNGVANSSNNVKPTPGHRIKNLLQLSLAMCIVKIKRTTGKETADEIMRILTRERFNNISFREEYEPVEKCDRRTEEVVEECRNKVMGTMGTALPDDSFKR